MTEDEMVGWYHQFNRYEFKQTPRNNEGQGSLACFSPRDSKELSTTEQLKKISALPFVPVLHVFIRSSNHPDFFGITFIVKIR